MQDIRGQYPRGGSFGLRGSSLQRPVRTYGFYIRHLLNDPSPSDTRCELMGIIIIIIIIIALEQALVRYRELGTSPELEVAIYSDSVYANKWMRGLSAGLSKTHWTAPVVDSLKQGSCAFVLESLTLDEEPKRLGLVEYIKIHKGRISMQNKIANML